MKNKIVIKGAREHNLKNVDLTIPRDQLVVFTGVSGSGNHQALAVSANSLQELSELSGGPEKICRIPVLLCKTVFRPDGKARCRPH